MLELRGSFARNRRPHQLERPRAFAIDTIIVSPDLNDFACIWHIFLATLTNPAATRQDYESALHEFVKRRLTGLWPVRRAMRATQGKRALIRPLSQAPIGTAALPYQ